MKLVVVDKIRKLRVKWHFEIALIVEWMRVRGLVSERASFRIMGRHFIKGLELYALRVKSGSIVPSDNIMEKLSELEAKLNK